MRMNLCAGTHGHKQRRRSNIILRSETVWKLLEEIELWRAAAREAQRELIRVKPCE